MFSQRRYMSANSKLTNKYANKNIVIPYLHLLIEIIIFYFIFIILKHLI